MFVDRFTTDNCKAFPGGEEHTLQQTEIHNKYKRLFESRIEAYLKKEGCSFQDFLDLSQSLLKESDEYSTFLDSLAIVDDFQAFAEMMRVKHLELYTDQE